MMTALVPLALWFDRLEGAGDAFDMIATIANLPFLVGIGILSDTFQLEPGLHLLVLIWLGWFAVLRIMKRRGVLDAAPDRLRIVPGRRDSRRSV
jgi:hypothetical protein